MSRIGKQPVSVPGPVKVTIKGDTVHVSGPRGAVEKSFASVVKIELTSQGTIVVSPDEESRFARAMFGTARSIIASMVKGVTDGYQKDLEIHGVGFKAVLKGRTLDLALGYSHPIVYQLPEGVKVTVVDATKVKIEGCDKQLVGAVAADLRAYYPPEPYKGKGVRIVGERVRRKEGKTVA